MVLAGPDGTGALDADGRPVPGAVELAGMPARALASEAIVSSASRAHPPVAAPPRPRASRGARGQPAVTRPGPGRGAGRPVGLPQPLVAPPGLRAVRLQRPVQHGRGPGRGAAVCGSRARPRRSSPRPTATRRSAPRPVAGRRAVRRRGGPQRVDHRRPPAGRHELPQLRRSDPAGGLLAAGRGRPRPRRRLRRAGPPVTGGNVSLYNEAPGSAIAPTPEIGIVGLLDDVAGASGRRSAATATPSCWWARPAPGSRAPSTSGSPAPPPRTGRRASTWTASGAPGVHPRGHRPGSRRELPGRVGGWVRGRRRGDVHLGRARGAPPAAGGRFAGRGAVRREPVAPGLRGGSTARPGLRAARPPARAPGRAHRHHRRRRGC